jgi:hypothetical protein
MSFKKELEDGFKRGFNRSMSSSSSSSGIGFFGLLTVALVVLKLTGFIDWSWWLVLAPLYIPIFLVLLVVLFFVRLFLK